MFAVIAAYFNPLGWASRERNYRAFRAGLEKIGVTPLIVEGVLDGQLPEIEDAIHVKMRSVLWQKEALLNIALQNLPKGIKGVFWVDADLLFLDDKIFEKGMKVLENHQVIQPFSRVCRLPPAAIAVVGGCQTHLSLGYRSSRLGNAVFAENKEEDSGTVGYMWAGRRSFLEACQGFYDAAVIDGGDRLMANAFLGQIDSEFLRNRLNCWQLKHFQEWAANAAVGDIGYVPGTILHLHHGSMQNRLYEERHKVFQTFSFNPYRDIKKDADGIYNWTSDKRAMQRAVKDYLLARSEDE